MRSEPQSHKLFLASVALPATLAFGVLFLVPLFESVIAQLGALPLALRTLLATRKWWLVLPALFYVLGAHTRWGKGHSKLLYNVSSTVTTLLAAFVVFACYGPILALVRLAG